MPIYQVQFCIAMQNELGGWHAHDRESSIISPRVVVEFSKTGSSNSTELYVEAHNVPVSETGEGIIASCH